MTKCNESLQDSNCLASLISMSTKFLYFDEKFMAIFGFYGALFITLSLIQDKPSKIFPEYVSNEFAFRK